MFAQDLMPVDDVHGWGHVVRVLELCEEIAQFEQCNLRILKISALLHDVGRAIEGKPENIGINHSLLSERLAEPFLRELGLPPQDIGNVLHCIRAHCFSAGVPPESIEAKVLSDADKLDALGAIGIYRMVVFQQPSQKGIVGLAEHLDEKLLRLTGQLHTPTAKRLAKPRHALLVAFREEIRREFHF